MTRKLKRIELKGISRNPADRRMQDGGLAESMNLQMDGGDNMPALAPGNATQTVTGSSSAVTALPGNDIKPIYLHKTPAYEHLIVYAPHRMNTTGSTIGGVAGKSYGAYVNGTLTWFLRFNSESEDNMYTDITSIGNTLIISTPAGLQYVLFKDGAYKSLGTEVPSPEILFHEGIIRDDAEYVLAHYTYSSAAGMYARTPSGTDTIPLRVSDGGDFRVNDWYSPALGGTPGLEDGYKASILSAIWDAIDLFKNNTTYYGAGRTIWPIFIRYAVRLYDGSLIHISAPILLGGDVKNPVAVKITSAANHKATTTSDAPTEEFDGETITTFFNAYAEVTTASPYEINFRLLENLYNKFSGWEDIVESIDIFASSPIVPIRHDSLYITERTVTTYSQDDTRYTDIWGAIGGPRGQSIASVTVKAILDKANYYDNPYEVLMNHQVMHLIKSIPFADLSNYTTGTNYKPAVNLNSDNIESLPVLKETYQSCHHIYGSNMKSYNGRLILSDIKLELTKGKSHLLSPRFSNTTSAEDPSVGTMEVFYFVNTGNGVKVMNKQMNMSYAPTGDEQRTGPWMAYPDSRCTKIVVWRSSTAQATTSTSGYVDEYKTHICSAMDVAYTFVGFGNSINGYQGPESYTGGQMTLGEARNYFLGNHGDSEELANTVRMSDVHNPFTFPAEGELQVQDGSILTAIPASNAVSTGQYGAGLALFTDAGIYLAPVARDGNFTTPELLSREVAVSARAVTQLDQAVVFVTNKGVSLMVFSSSGGVLSASITNISAGMIGPHYNFAQTDAGAYALLDTLVFKSAQLAALSDGAPFMQFMAAAHAAYDYAGQRLVFFSDGKQYQYVYEFKGGTWHKIAMSSALELRGYVVLNSYPEAYVAAEAPSGTWTIYDYSTPLRVAETQLTALPGVIVTRPIDFENPDVNKTIHRVRLRGDMSRGHVKYALLGSNDGIHFTLLNSTHGRSWKWYRIVAVSSLSPLERLSYIEVEYEERFLDRIR